MSFVQFRSLTTSICSVHNNSPPTYNTTLERKHTSNNALCDDTSTPQPVVAITDPDLGTNPTTNVPPSTELLRTPTPSTLRRSSRKTNATFVFFVVFFF